MKQFKMANTCNRTQNMLKMEIAYFEVIQVFCLWIVEYYNPR